MSGVLGIAVPGRKMSATAIGCVVLGRGRRERARSSACVETISSPRRVDSLFLGLTTMK